MFRDDCKDAQCKATVLHMHMHATTRLRSIGKNACVTAVLLKGVQGISAWLSLAQKILTEVVE